MPRARNIKPSFFKNEDLVELPFEDRLLFAGLWTLADKRGVLEDRPKRIKMELFPADMVDVDASLNRLEERGFLQRYDANGTRAIYIPKFTKHQNPHKNEQPSDIQAPDHVEQVIDSSKETEQHGASTVQARCKHGASTVQAPEQHGAAHADSLLLIPDSLNTPHSPPRGGEYPDDFERFWSEYPKRVGKGAAGKVWKKLPVADRKAILDDVRLRRRTHDPWLRDGGKFIPNPTTYLNQRRWEDDIVQDESQAKSPREVASWI